MTMNKILSIVGAVLLTAAIILAFTTSNNAEKMLAKKDETVMKYLSKSQEALKEENISAALNYAKLAIQASPKNKKAFEAYNDAMKLKYAPSQDDITSTPVTAPKATEEEAPDMGC